MLAHRDFAASCVYLLFAVINGTAKAVYQVGNALLYKQAVLGGKIVPRRESSDALDVMGSISVILLGKVTSKIYLNRAEI